MAEVEVQTITEVSTVAVDHPAIEEKLEEAVVGEPKPEKAKAKKKSAPRKASTHPPFYNMVSEAIATLKEKSGSSQYAIQKFVEDKHKQLPTNFRKMLLVQLKKFVASKKLVKVKNSYKLPATKAPSPPKPAAKKSTVTKPKTGIAAKKRTAKKPVAKSPAKPKVVSKVKPNAKAAGKPKVTAKPKAPAAKPKATAVAKRKAVGKPKAKAKPSKVAKTSAAASPSAKKAPAAAKTKKKAAALVKKAAAPAKKNPAKAKATPKKAKSVKAPARRTSARKSAK